MSGASESSLTTLPTTPCPTPQPAPRSAQQILDHLTARLDRWEQKAGLPLTSPPPPEFHRYLEPDRAFLRGLNAEDCGEIALLLTQVAFHLQRLTNHERTTALVLRERIVRRVVAKTGDLAYKTAEEKWHLTLMEEPTLAQMDGLRVAALARAERVSFLTQRLEAVAKLYGELQQTKRKQHG
jgi:hypothetical protein